MDDLCPDDPEYYCPTCGGRIPDEQEIAYTDYYGVDDTEGSFTRYYCSQACINERR